MATDLAAESFERPRRYQTWIAAAILLLAGGVAATVLGAGAVARNDEVISRQDFEQSSSEVAAALQLAIQRQQDLVVNASAFFLTNPTGSNAEFIRWTETVQLAQRYPELLGLVYINFVPAAGLPAFAERMTAEAAVTGGPAFAIVPPGERPFYCLVSVGLALNPTQYTPPGFDVCAIPDVVDLLLAARDSGLGAYMPYEHEAQHWLAIQTPIYAGAIVPDTIEERREQFLGWAGTLADPSFLLDLALQGRPGIAVSMKHEVYAGEPLERGTPSENAHAVTTDLRDGWTVTTFGSVASGGVFGHASSIAVFVAGLAVSLLLAALVLVLGTGRARALRMVGLRTGELRHQALHDALSGLPNRALIMDRIEQLLARNRRSGTYGAALFIDLDDFKNVNDTLGHAAGDQLLVAVAARLESTLRDADTIGRMGGDEFVVLIDGTPLHLSPELVAERLLDVMRQPFELTDAALPLTVNISIGIATGDRATGGELLRDADVALYQAKAAGKNRYAIFHAEMQSEISERLELEFDLRSALTGEQFRLVYQPIYNLDDLVMIGVEALLRWEHPTRGLVQPDEFIPILEQTGEIREVGKWVLLQACKQMATWHARGDTLDVSVNVSGRQRDDDAVVGHIRHALSASGLEATSLIIEVTETALMRNASATGRRLQAIKDLGVRIAVDDFGTGYSSLAYLQQFPVDCIKIDRAFTNAITTSPESKALVRTLVQLGRDLGLRTLAEGVETTGQMDHLRSEHVNEAQGFLLARPLEPDELEVRLLAPMRPKHDAA